MDLKIIKQTENEITGVVDKTSPAMLNALRRAASFEVPVLAIEDVDFKQNSSALWDEMVALRLGLVPLISDLKSYTPVDKYDSETFSAKNSVKGTLKAKGPVTVYASDIKFKDPAVKAVFPNMLIVELLENQEIELEVTAVMGRGVEHSKWSAGHFFYRGYPEFDIANGNVAKVLETVPQLEKSGNSVKIKDESKWNESYDSICEKNGIKITNRNDKFIFTFESWGQLTPKEILTEAVNLVQEKLKEAKL
ncbi:MAG: DNA-directed RNA polymerase subunit D [DPANN group archaeon]|nr:DNA-directed RNA polymerase subunit D [DPANN group archaeon]